MMRFKTLKMRLAEFISIYNPILMMPQVVPGAKPPGSMVTKNKIRTNDMTKTHEFVLGKTDYRTAFEGHILDVEYVISSVSDDIKVVDVWRYWDSENHNHSTPNMEQEVRLSWLSEGFKEKLYETLRELEGIA